MNSLFWGIVSAVFIILELILPGLITIWFGLAGIVMIFLAPLIKDTSLEFYIFATISLLLLLITRPIAKKYFYKKGVDKEKIDFNNRMTSRETKIVKVLDEGIYEVIIDEQPWRAVSDDVLQIGENVQITNIKGNKLVVKKLDKK